MPVKSDEVSVVVQGPVEPVTAAVVTSVRRYLPGAQLIVSTWAGTQAGHLRADEVVFSDDPGSVAYRELDGSLSPRLFNTNRMFRSTRSGFARADRPYAMKLRSDSPLTGDGMLSWFGRFERRAPQLQVFGQRVLTTTIATRPAKTMPGHLFHPSDCSHFGRSEDVVGLWSAAEIDEESNAGYRLPPAESLTGLSIRARYWNEQVLWLACLAAAGHEVVYPHIGYTEPELGERSDLSIVNNFVVLEPWQFGISFPSLRVPTQMASMDSYMWYRDWLEGYRQLCS